MPTDGRLVAFARRLERFGWRVRWWAVKVRRWSMLPEDYEWVPAADRMRWMVSGRPGDRLWAELDGMTIHFLRRQGYDRGALAAYAMVHGERKRGD